MATANLNLNVDVNKTCHDFCQRGTFSTLPREEATQEIVAHFRRAYPKYNVMVVHTPHLKTFDDCAHSHIVLGCYAFFTARFEVYVFKRGEFTLLGDSGFINWAFEGNFTRNCNKVTFRDN